MAKQTLVKLVIPLEVNAEKITHTWELVQEKKKKFGIRLLGAVHGDHEIIMTSRNYCDAGKEFADFLNRIHLLDKLPNEVKVLLTDCFTPAPACPCCVRKGSQNHSCYIFDFTDKDREDA